MVERGECVRLATTELRDQRKDRRRVLGLARESPEHHPGMLLQRPGEAGPREELGRVAVILGSRLCDHLLEGDGELVRTERAAFPDFLTEGHDFVPRVHDSPPVTAFAYG